jgi:S-formylglutathione hydrolase FrmB
MAVALAGTSGLLGTGAPAAAAPPLDAPASGNGITVTGWSPVDLDIFDPDNPLMYDAAVTTEAVFTPATAPDVTLNVRFHLPAGYDPDRAQGYPVLYLLHGGAGKWSDWSEWNVGDLPRAIEDSGYPGIVVMPEGGRSGWYQDWATNTRGGFRPLWETFHTDQLVGWVDANFNTDASRDGRAIAGVSMGGFGALKYAGRHADTFGTVGAFSPGTDIHGPDHPDRDGDQSAIEIIDGAVAAAGASIVFQGLGLDFMDYRMPGTTPEARMAQVFGPQAAWPAINPQDMAEAGAYDAYDGDIAIYVGTGEGDLHQWTSDFEQALGDDGHRYCAGPGDHTWPYWKVHLTHFLQVLQGTETVACPDTDI